MKKEPDAIDQLLKRIERLRVEYERFFNGALDIPPEEERGELQAAIRALRLKPQRTSIDRFRFGQLEARFNSYNELFNRRVRNFELGKTQRRDDDRRPTVDLEEGFVVGHSVDPAAAEALYKGLAASSDKAPKFDLPSFRNYLGKQAQTIQQRTGCAQVRFRLIREDGRMRLKAKPIQSR